MSEDNIPLDINLSEEELVKMSEAIRDKARFEGRLNVDRRRSSARMRKQQR